MKSPIEALPLPQIVYETEGHKYFTPADDGTWISISEGGAKRLLEKSGYSSKRSDLGSDLDDCLDRVVRTQNVNYAAPLAGYETGLYNLVGRKILVTKGPELIVPVEGTWPVLNQLLEGMLKWDDLDQREYFFGWMTQALTAIHKGDPNMPGQLLALAGPPGSGKSLLQGLITKLLGGRVAKPAAYMNACTPFNGELSQAEHLALDDEAEKTNINARVHFGNLIKQLTVAGEQYCHGKGKTPITLKPIQRLTMSLNDDPQRILVLPPLDGDIEDKILLLKVKGSPMPMPTNTRDEKQAFMRTLHAELPAFVYAMLNHEVPEEVRDSRYGVKSFHHPALVEALRESSPETILLQLMDACSYYPTDRTAPQIREELNTRPSLKAQVNQLFPYPNACGTYLARLARICGSRVTSRRLNGHVLYTVAPLPTALTNGTHGIANPI
jgi:hypothetical protein